MDIVEDDGLPLGRPMVPTDVIAKWMASVADGSWTWLRNPKCKYVSLGIDTRRGAYRVNDRDDTPISAEELLWQYGTKSAALTPPLPLVGE